jgi:hypothetical protein
MTGVSRSFGVADRVGSGWRLAVLSLGTLLVAMGCERPKELRIPLDYAPKDHLELAGFTPPPGLRLAVTATDARTDNSAIGRNSEDESKPVPIYTTSRPPEEFLRDAVSRGLATAGITIAPDRTGATKVLNLALKKFWVEETGTYQGTITADADLRDATGGRLWQGQVSGNNKRFGRSLSADNYDECLSDASIDLVQNLLRNEAFTAGLRAEGSRTRPTTRKTK